MAVVICNNPRECGVISHIAGSESHTRCGTMRDGVPVSNSSSRNLSAAPRPMTSSYESDEPMTGADLKELHERSAKVNEEITRLVRLGNKQVQAGVRKDLNLSDDDTVEVIAGTILSPVNRVSARVKKVGEHETVYVQRKSRYLPTRKTEGKVSLDEISDLNDERSAVSEQFGEVIKRTQEGVEDWVARKVRNTQYDEVRVVESTAMSEGEFITANLYNNGVDAGYWRIPRSDIFRD